METKMEHNGWLSKEKMQEIRDLVPIVCTDMFIIIGTEGYLWIKRDIIPEKDCWAPVGGRILKNETMLQACKRIAKREAGLDVEVLRQVGASEQFFKELNLHAVSVFHLAKSDDVVRLNDESTEYKISWEPPEGTPEWYREMLKI